MLPICSLVRCSSSRMTGISGAMPNQPKKQRKNASHVMWKARIGTLRKSSRRIAVALSTMFTRSVSCGFVASAHEAACVEARVIDASMTTPSSTFVG